MGIIGLGRIGKIHLSNLEKSTMVGEIYLCDWSEKAFQRFGEGHFPFFSDHAQMIEETSPDAVFICSSTPSHIPIIQYCCEKNIDVFCEKPLDLELEKIIAIKESIGKSGINLQVGFNRRFDPDFSLLKKKILEGQIGEIHQIVITSRDPGLAPLDYIASSGGMFLDMTIHDFDMARFLTDSEVKEVYAKGQIRMYPEIAAYEDIDTATVVLTFDNDATCTIINSRKAEYGYDQRIEVFGSKGMLMASNKFEHRLQYWGSESVMISKPEHFFLERYARAYKIESDEFMKMISTKGPVSVGVEDALRATEIAVFANQSMQSSKVITVNHSISPR